MREVDYNPKRAIGLGGQIVTGSAFTDYITTIKFPSLTLPEAKMAMRKAQTGDTSWPDDMPEAKRLEIQRAVVAYTKGYTDAEGLIKELREKTEADSVMKALERDKWINTYKDTDSTTIVQPMSEVLSRSVALALGDNFTIEGTTIVLREGVDPKSAFAPAFKNLNDLYDKAMDLEQGFAITEARLAIAAEKILGRDWPLALYGADRADMIRIKKNKNAIARMEEAGFQSNDIPIGTIRVLTEVNYDPGNEAVNKDIRKKVITQFFEESQKKGGYLTQADSRTLVERAVPVNRRATQQWDTYYLIADTGKKPKMVGSMGIVKELFDKAIHVVDRKTSCLIYVLPSGDYTYEPIPTYAGAPSREAIDGQEKPAAAKVVEPIVVDFTSKTEPKLEPVEEVSDLDSLFD